MTEPYTPLTTRADTDDLEFLRRLGDVVTECHNLAVDIGFATAPIELTTQALQVIVGTFGTFGDPTPRTTLTVDAATAARICFLALLVDATTGDGDAGFADMMSTLGYDSVDITTGVRVDRAGSVERTTS